MSYANGTCKHNNLTGTCPSCLRERSVNKRMMRGMGRLNGMGCGGGCGGCGNKTMGSFGADCPAGFYRLKVFGVDTGQCLPSLNTAITGAQGGALSTIATGAAGSSANIAAVKEGIVSSTIKSISSSIATRPVLWGAVALGAVGLISYGGLKIFKRG